MEGKTYEDAGVSLAFAESVVERLRAAVESTGTTGFGAFAGLYPLDEERLLAASMDSAGTKLVLARKAGRLRGIGAAPAKLPGASAEDELGADRVGRGREQSPVVDREEACEGTELTCHARRGGGHDGPPQPLHDRIGRRERHTRGGIRVLLRHLPESTDPTSTVTT